MAIIIILLIDEKVMWMKDLKIFENKFAKQETSLLIYNAIIYIKNSSLPF